MNDKGPIYTKSFEFALMMIHLHTRLNVLKHFDISRQILRSGTSIGANVNEASAAISKRDFTNKMSIASKEARESLFWLKLIRQSESLKVDVKPRIRSVFRISKAVNSYSQDQSTKH